MRRRAFLGGGLALVAGCGTSARTPDAQPQRIVALGYGRDADTLTALGRIPVAVQRTSSRPNGFDPWLEAALGAHRPQLLDAASEPPLEAIAALAPDLITATSYYPIERFRHRLSEIAPVLGPADRPNTDDWRTTTTRVARAVGVPDRAKTLIDQLDRQLNTVRTTTRQGRTYTFSSFHAGRVSVKCAPDDVQARTLAEFGLRLSPAIAALPEGSTPGFAQVSLEQLGILDADLVLVVGRTGDQPVVRQAIAGLRGRLIQLSDAEAHALAFPSVLTLPYVVETLLPRW
ncbi:ABC transporter substrate-binding protein [Kribbella sp. NBC_01505]|uniref:ABC transporter substrate-binding protein n=1 Tax=Kribbella sp. NBC_01505 TaxID=2903580 RepID=UPI0038675DA7